MIDYLLLLACILATAFVCSSLVWMVNNFQEWRDNRRVRAQWAREKEGR